ncbi:MAG: S8 family serine peptidase [Verrucomicrobia bacterium]|nr:MAG: S8 family serine peptidase [Verrucomicrobiota bacterium]
MTRFGIARGSLFGGGCWLLVSVPALAQTVSHATIGLTDLLARYGAGAPNGSSVSVWQTEAGAAGSTFPGVALSPGEYVPFDGNGVSGHAAAVAAEFYAAGSGISQAVPYVWTMNANQFIGGGGLKAVSSLAPAIPVMVDLNTGLRLPQPQVMNASWIGGANAADGYTAAEINADVNRRLDFLVATRGLTAVVGVDNAPSTPAPLLGQSYNAIAVGLSNLSAAQGYSNVDGNGRMVVDIVAPTSATSYATPAVAGAATLLVDRANKTPLLADAADPMVVRSLLMTGARKLPGWEHGEAGTADDVVHPLDKIQGAGELRVNNAYDILMAGEKAAGSHSIGLGWSLSSIAKDGIQYYFVDNPHAGGTLTATLNWNRTSDGTPDGRGLIGGDVLADLNLEVFASDDGDTIGGTLARSASTLDNVEHIFLSGLGVGRFAIAVEGVDAAAYALSFQVVPEPTTLGAGAGLAVLGAVWAWRRSVGAGR